MLCAHRPGFNIAFLHVPTSPAGSESARSSGFSRARLLSAYQFFGREIGSSISRVPHVNYAQSSVTASARSGYSSLPRPWLARLTREDEVSELRIVGALFRALATGQQRFALSLLYVGAAASEHWLPPTPAPFVTTLVLSREGLAHDISSLIGASGWLDWETEKPIARNGAK